MNETYTREFVHQALRAGVPQEKIAAVLERARSISKPVVKTASSTDIINDLITGAGMEKSASSVSYVQGIFKEAFDNGADVSTAIEFTKKALDATNERLAYIEKISTITQDPALNQYAEGFLSQAKQAGLSDDESVSLLLNVIDQEKQANEMMFKQPQQGLEAGPQDPGMGAGPEQGMGAGPQDPGMGAGPEQGADPEQAQLLEMLQQLPPEEQQKIIQQLLAAIGGGQGGPQGPGGAPQPGGPQGPV